MRTVRSSPMKPTIRSSRTANTALTGSGVTVFMTTEVAQSFSDLRFSSDLISFLTDDVIVQRYVEIEGEMRKVMTVIKMRGSEHSKELRLYDVTKTGLVVGGSLHDYRGIITGVAQRYQSTEAGIAVNKGV